MSKAGVASSASACDALAGVYAQRITAALPIMWARHVSMHDSHGTVRWQSDDIWGPAEREAANVALEEFVGQAAPARTDFELTDQRTAVLVRAADVDNVFRGFIMLVVDTRRLKGRGRLAHDLPAPVQRAAHDWAMKLANQALTKPLVESVNPELTAEQTDRLLALPAAAAEPDADEFFARLRAFPATVVAQPLIPLQRGTRIRRYEVLLREATATPLDAAPLSLLREADDRGLGSVLDRRVAGMLVVWLAKRSAAFADEAAQFSVNLSGSSLADPTFLQFIEMCLAKTHLPPALLAFEIDQSYWRLERGCLERIANGIAAMGSSLVIDNCTLDEGTADLLSLPSVRLAKIDPRLTHGVLTSRVAQMRVAGIAQLAHVGGVHTVAKQVEREQDQDLLRALGVDFVQSRLAAAPTSLDTLEVDGLARQGAEGLVIESSERRAELSAAL